MNFWEKIKKDLQKGVEESMVFVKEGAAVLQKKASELTDEGLRRYALYELKTKVQKEIAELGGKVYDLSSKVRNPMLDSGVTAIKARIGKLQAEIMKLEEKPATTHKRTTSKKRLVKKSKKPRAATN